MCGIAGILRVHQPRAALPPPQQAIPDAWLDILDEGIRHRGPDGQGRFRDRVVRRDGAVVDVALVHRRLAIIDPDTGHQPMIDDRGPGHPDRPRSGRVVAVFNGCIYNHRDLRRQLQSAEHEFRTDHSDTEVIIHGWRQWGPRLPEHLHGMYALAIWDALDAGLFLARDPFGEKPLYVVGEPRGSIGTICAFASSPAPLLALPDEVFPGGSRGLVRPRRIWDWIRKGYGSSPYRAIRLLAPEQQSRLGEDLARLHQYLHRSAPPGADPASWPPPLDPDRTLDLLRQAVERRLEADVPLGCFLSGGVDSSLVAALARSAVGRLRTFTVRMPDPRYDESAHAERVAGAISAEHATLDCRARPAEDLEALIRTLGLPFGDSSLLPASWVSRAAREHVKVALCGDGGDELFCGYDRYVAAQWLQRWHAPARLLPSADTLGGHPKSLRSRLGRLGDAARARNQHELNAIFSLEDMARLTGRPEPPRLRPDRWGAARLRLWDLRDYLPNDLLRKTDAASMAFALEVRSPFLDHDLARAALATPIETLMPQGQRKGLLRAVARRLLPPDVADRPKMGFAIPVGEWFRTDFGGMKQLLVDHLHSAEPFGPPRLGLDLRLSFVRRLIDEHMTGRRDHSQRLYMLLVLSIWSRWLGQVSRRG